MRTTALYLRLAIARPPRMRTPSWSGLKYEQCGFFRTCPEGGEASPVSRLDEWRRNITTGKEEEGDRPRRAARSATPSARLA